MPLLLSTNDTVGSSLFGEAIMVKELTVFSSELAITSLRNKFCLFSHTPRECNLRNTHNSSNGGMAPPASTTRSYTLSSLSSETFCKSTHENNLGFYCFARPQLSGLIETYRESKPRVTGAREGVIQITNVQNINNSCIYQ